MMMWGRKRKSKDNEGWWAALWTHSPILAYNGGTGRHQNRKVCQVTTAAWGVGVIRVCPFTALRRPAAIPHVIDWVVPKGTLCPVLIWHLKNRHSTCETISISPALVVFKTSLIELAPCLACKHRISADTGHLFFCSRFEIYIAAVLHTFSIL